VDPFPFIEAVTANLADAAPKLVYADWLDEHRFPNRAGFVRYLGRTGRWPAYVGGNHLVFHPETDVAPAQHRLPVVFHPWLLNSFDGTYYGREFSNGWPAVERAGGEAWLNLVTRPRRRWLGLRPPYLWVPDYTPVVRQDFRDEQVARWAGGVR
jgi:uncharacterized protein (TIGR02996 family)